jgi:hypothetical protein
MESTVITKENVVFGNGQVLTLTYQKVSDNEALYSITGDNGTVAFGNRVGGWDEIFGDFVEFVEEYSCDKIVLAHRGDLWRTDEKERKLLEDVYRSYMVLTKAIIDAVGSKTVALACAREYIGL